MELTKKSSIMLQLNIENKKFPQHHEQDIFSPLEKLL
jgi:hypothetical protein